MSIKAMKATFVIGAALAVLGVAQTASAAAQTTAVREYAIERQNLGNALRRFAIESGVDVAYDPAIVRGRTSQGVRGKLGAEAALRMLLTGSGLSLRRTASGGYAVARPLTRTAATKGQAYVQNAPASAPTYFAPQSQEAVADVPSATDEAADPIVVTGSRIAIPGIASPVPVTSVTPEALPSGGSLSLGDSLDRLPQLRSTFNSNNSGRFGRVGTAGVNLLDLRGLGTARTLTLINGRRQVTSIPGEFVVDVNSIPADLVERIDIVTGGNSAIYGSDAVAGVVNFITKRDFEGFRLNVRGGIDSRGIRGQYMSSLTAGTNFADGRGNIAGSLEYSKVNPVHASDRDDLTGYYTGARRFQIAEPTAGEPSAGDGIPDNGFYEGIRFSSSTGGMISAVCNAASTANRARCTAGGYAQRYVFMPDGSLVAEAPTLDFRDLTAGSNLSTIGGLGYSEVAAGNLAAGLQRFVANVTARFEVSDALQPFMEAKAVRVKSAAAFQPSFFSGSLASSLAGFAGNSQPVDFRCSNPFLSTQALTTLQSVGLCANVDTGTFNINRFNVDLGERKEAITRDTYRVIAGVEGTFNTDWKYEVSFNYGELKSKMTTGDSLYVPNFYRAVDAVKNSAGRIVCRINADSITTNDDPACAPVNMFGSGAATADARAYVLRSVRMDSKASQFVASGFVSGDSSQLFELPGGPVGFVLGGEYRRETASMIYDELGQSLTTYGPSGPPFTPPALVVKDAFAEISLPLLRDLPFAEQLTVSGSARVSDYDSSAGTVWAYNIGAFYAPVRDIRFRVGYSQSVRVPTLADLYAAAQFTSPSVRDACDVLYVNTGSSSRAANCAAAGLPANFENTVARRQSITATTAGNPNLRAETARSLTIGAVFQPRYLQGLTLTVDYYDIDLKKMIAPVTAQQIVDNCYDAPSLDNVYCPLITREASGLFAFRGIRVTTVNFASQKTRGLDISLSYRRSFGDWSVDLNALATRVLQLDNYTNVATPTIPNRQLSELGDPKLSGNLSLNVGYRNVTVGYELQYIGRQTIGTYEAQHSYAGQAPTNADEYADPWIKPVTYHGLRISADIGRMFNFYGGVDNLFDKKPPYLLVSPTGNGAVYDLFGRSFYAGAKLSF
jgi:outer membrane receptor protein involved in Fe transport